MNDHPYSAGEIMNRLFRAFHHVVRSVGLIGIAAQFSSAQWVQQTSNAVDNLTDVVMLDSMKAIAVGDRNSILLTTDAGTTWVNTTIIFSSTFHWRQVSFFDKQNGAVVGDRTLWTTKDGATTWTVRPLPPGSPTCLSVLLAGTTRVYVGADSGWVHYSNDTGHTWTSEKISQWPIRSLFSWPGVYLFGLPLFALTPYSICDKIELLSGWHETVLKEFQGLGSQAFRGTFPDGGGPQYVVGVRGDLRAAPAIIRRKQLSDTIWTGLGQGILFDGTLLGISAPSTDVIYVCGDGGLLFKSTNAGDAWQSFVAVTTRRLRALSFYGVSRGMAVGDSGTILYTNNGGVTAVEPGHNGQPAAFSLEQNYPNPFNPMTHFQFTISNLQFVTLKVFDLLGREVAALVSERKPAGSYDATWNAANFSSGVYLYQLRAGSFTQTKKMLLMK